MYDKDYKFDISWKDSNCKRWKTSVLTVWFLWKKLCLGIFGLKLAWNFPPCPRKCWDFGDMKTNPPGGLEITERRNVCTARLAVSDTKSWREAFKTLVLLEYLLTHGPESFAADFRSEKDVLHQLTHFEHVDELGYFYILSLFF